MAHYDAQATRDGEWWTVTIPQLDGHTQAAHIDDVPQAAREFIAATLDEPIDTITVTVSVGPAVQIPTE